jgi:hypothetical protein
LADAIVELSGRISYISPQTGRALREIAVNAKPFDFSNHRLIHTVYVMADSMIHTRAPSSRQQAIALLPGILQSLASQSLKFCANWIFDFVLHCVRILLQMPWGDSRPVSAASLAAVLHALLPDIDPDRQDKDLVSAIRASLEDAGGK